MRFVPVNCLRDGMLSGRDLFGRNGEFLLSKGSVIRASYVDKIREQGLNGIYIDDEISKDVQVSELISENLKCKTINTLKSTFQKLEKGIKVTKETIVDINQLVDDIVQNVLSSKDIMVNMIDLKVFDDYTFYHSVNVTVLSIVTGVSLNLNKDQLYKLALAALLHDIGKVFVPKEILNKPGALTEDEFDIIKTHSYKGYEYLKDKFEVPILTYLGVLQHHEKFDGRGYPMNLKGTQISLFGRIISVADVYDALTSKRSYRNAMAPSEAIEYVMGGGGLFFDPAIAVSFVKKVAPYPVGTFVYLSNNKTGMVMENYTNNCLRPKIKILKHGNTDIEPYIMDLYNDKNTRDVTITGIVEDLYAMTG